jgi:hypothetical protein
MLAGGIRASINIVIHYSDIGVSRQLLLYKVDAMASHEVEEE